MSVILNEVKNLVESMGWKTEILRLMPQNDIATQSQREGGEGGIKNGGVSNVWRRKNQNSEDR
ncbi:MAG TPA: hypothetical protein VJ462_02775 [Thermodesulfobacteriota bacterium]|jgi:hypothetical protein|nr:hypothetical protein [Thermodesulfobacteriota bacterium]